MERCPLQKCGGFREWRGGFTRSGRVSLMEHRTGLMKLPIVEESFLCGAIVGILRLYAKKACALFPTLILLEGCQLLTGNADVTVAETIQSMARMLLCPASRYPKARLAEAQSCGLVT